MYDEIQFEYPLPDKEAQAEIYQTYDTGREMDRYILANDGVFYHEPWQVDSSGFPMYGVSTYKRVKSKYTGFIDCYGDVQLPWKRNGNRTVYEYRFELKDGTLVSAIERFNVEV